MTKDNIIVLPNQKLRKKSVKITQIDRKINHVVDMMKNATLDWDMSRQHEVGVALAAVQIDQLYRIIIIREDFDEKENKNFQVFINPKITKLSGQLLEDYEGCLSVPDIYGKVLRYDQVRVKALDQEAREITISASGFLARVLQHEIDHTNGKLFIDHIKNQPDAFYRLSPKGDLIKLDYKKDVQNNHILW
jgi:peptide deformylase